MNASPFKKVLSAIREYKTSGDGFQARCPAHDDAKLSLVINTASDGTVVLKCRAGCSTDAVVRSLGLTLNDLFRRFNEEEVIGGDS